MQVLCTGYFNTGFTKDNFPDSPALLASSAEYTVNFGYLDLFQIDDLTSLPITLQGDYVPLKGGGIIGQNSFNDPNEPSNLDYIVLATDVNYPVFYRVTGYKNLDAGTVELYLEKDPLLTIGGVSNLEILDGITERVSVSPSLGFDEIPIEEDPLLVPSRPLEVYEGGTAEPNGSGGSFVTDYIIVETALDLVSMGQDYANDVPGSAIKYITTSGEDVSVPVPKFLGANDNFTKIKIDGLATEFKTPGTAYFNVAGGSDASKGLEVTNGLGLTNAIVASYRLPRKCVTNASSAGGGKLSVLEGVWEDRQIAWSTEAHRNVYPQYVFEYPVFNGADPYIVKNKRVFCGELNKYTIQSLATGEKIECKPEDLFHPGSVLPAPCIVTDPRSSGRPYYRFRYVRNTDGMNSIEEFMRYAIRGMQWAEAPQVYTSKGGSIIDNLNYRMEDDISNFNFQVDRSSFTRPLKDILAMVKGTVNTIGAPTASLEGTDALTRSAGFWHYNRDILKQSQENVKRDIDFNISQHVIAPTITFPINETMRDFVGNGCICYRIRPTDLDIVRMDRMLTMYGNRWTRTLRASDFTNRPNFNYVKASGVVVKSATNQRIKSSMRLADQVSDLLSGGVRIWHKKPAFSYYNQAN